MKYGIVNLERILTANFLNFKVKQTFRKCKQAASH